MPETKEAPSLSAGKQIARTYSYSFIGGDEEEGLAMAIDAAVEQARREVWERAVNIAKQVAAWPNAGIVGRQVIALLEAAAGNEMVCKNCGCPPPKGGEIGEWCSACGAGVEYEFAKEFERRHGSTSK